MARDAIELKQEELLACSSGLFDQSQPTENPRARHDEQRIHPRGDEQNRGRSGEQNS
jgi:hypothetical protein